jgi:hypothetical protein
MRSLFSETRIITAEEIFKYAEPLLGGLRGLDHPLAKDSVQFTEGRLDAVKLARATGNVVLGVVRVDDRQTITVLVRECFDLVLHDTRLARRWGGEETSRNTDLRNVPGRIHRYRHRLVFEAIAIEI